MNLLRYFAFTLCVDTSSESPAFFVQSGIIYWIGIALQKDNILNMCTDGRAERAQYSGMTIGKTELIFLIDRAKDAVYCFKVAVRTISTSAKRSIAFLKTDIYSWIIFTPRNRLWNISNWRRLSSELQIGYW